MSDGIRFVLDGERSRRARRDHLAGRQPPRRRDPAPLLPARAGYRPDGNCRACMVEIEGERVLAASCCAGPTPGMEVKTATRARQNLAQDRVRAARRRPARARESRTTRTRAFWNWADRVAVDDSRFPAVRRLVGHDDLSHPAMAVHLDACIQCTRCVRACREEQVNDVIGMASRGPSREDRLRLRRPDGRHRPASPAASACRPARPAR